MRYNEIFVQSITMADGKFSDTGHRFRYNMFHRTDHWWTPKVIYNPFFYYVFYNSDTYDVPLGNKKIAEVFFRLASD